ncbi:hypothetical protein KC318_g18712, partial [Hortaea werneckii]
DNKDNVQSYTPGQNVDFTVDIRAPHTGYANVSIVKTSSNTMISDMLKKWDVYASTSTPVPDTDKEFSITMPSDLGDECATAGDCVIQWYWNAPDIDQTYEACVDFTMSGSGSGSGSGSSPAPSSSKAAQTTSQAAASSAPANTKVAQTTLKAASSTTTSEAVASTCACTNQKREAFAQDAASCASTTVVTSTAWATATTTAEHVKTVTATVTAQATDVSTAGKARKDLKGRSGNSAHPRDLAMN